MHIIYTNCNDGCCTKKEMVKIILIIINNHIAALTLHPQSWVELLTFGPKINALYLSDQTYNYTILAKLTILELTTPLPR